MYGLYFRKRTAADAVTAPSLVAGAASKTVTPKQANGEVNVAKKPKLSAKKAKVVDGPVKVRLWGKFAEIAPT